jgi:DNA-binding CsgD family transcriptional regulator/tetratricopeptide (TPR) repeat protein
MSSAQFIGRGGQLALFDEVLADATRGHGGVVLVAGEAGVGKTRFIAELTARSRQSGAVVVVGWCVENGELVLPLAPISDLLRDIVSQVPPSDVNDVLGPIGAELGRLVPELGSAGRPAPTGTSARLFDGMLGCLSRLGTRQPVVAVVEDVHWADESTRQLLAYLAPRLTGQPVILVMTFRNDELHRRHPLLPFVSSIRRAVRPEQIELLPFTASELVELTEAITHRHADKTAVSALHQRCGGNAFFAEELLAGERSSVLPWTLRDVVLSRVGTLDPTAQRVLRTAAAAGPRVDDAVLAVACQLDSAAIANAVESVQAAGLWVQRSDGIGFRHELTREVVAAELLAGERASVHAALASATEALAPERTGDVARHWLAAGDQPRALQASVAAARAAVSTGANAEAVLQFEQALELWDRVPDAQARAGCGRAALLLDTADAAGRARSFVKAVTLGQRGIRELSGNDPAEEGLACLRVTEWAWFTGQDDAARMLIERALACLPVDPPQDGGAMAVAWEALLLASSDADNPGRAAANQRAREAIAIAQACGSGRAEAHALLTIGICLCDQGDPAGLDQIRAALRLALSLNCDLEAGRAYDSLAVYLAVFGHHGDVIGMEQQVLDFCAAAGLQRVSGVMMELRVIRSLYRLGRWREAEVRAETLRTEFGSLRLEHFSLAGSWGSILVRQGRLDGVGEMVADELARVGDHITVIGGITVTAVELAAAENRLADIPGLVNAALDQVLPRFGRSAAEVVSSALAALADRTPATGSPRAAEHAVVQQMGAAWCERVEQACVAAIAQGTVPDVAPRVALARAELSRLRGDSSPAEWVELVRAWDDIGAQYESAYARWRLADLLLKGPERQAASTRAQARILMTAARGAASEMRADPLVAQIDALSRRAHVSLVAERPAQSAVSEVDHFGLTDREVEVLRLVADGFSNGQIGQALFISRKTASVHVSNILRKLDVSSRLEAATMAVMTRAR